MLNKNKAIDSIIENFNWGKVHHTMTLLNWTWATTENEVPSTGALFRCAMNLLHGAYDGAVKEKSNYINATGGFRATATVDEETKEVIELRLVFELTSWEAYDY